MSPHLGPGFAAPESGISLAVVGLGFGVDPFFSQQFPPSQLRIFLPFFFLAEIVPDIHTPTRILPKVSLGSSIRLVWPLGPSGFGFYGSPMAFACGGRCLCPSVVAQVSSDCFNPIALSPASHTRWL